MTEHLEQTVHKCVTAVVKFLVIKQQAVVQATALQATRASTAKVNLDYYPVVSGLQCTLCGDFY